MGQCPHALPLIRGILRALQDTREGREQVELRRKERDLLGVELLEGLLRVHEACSDDLLAAVGRRKAFLLVSVRETRGVCFVEECDIELRVETPETELVQCTSLL